MGVWDAFLSMVGGGEKTYKPNTFYSLSQIAEKKKPIVPPKTLFGAPVADKSVRQKPSKMFDEANYE